MGRLSIQTRTLLVVAPLVLFVAGCTTAPTPFEVWRAQHDKAADEWQEAAVKESEFVSKRADDLNPGMTPQEAQATLYRGVLTDAGFTSVSSTAGADGRVDVCRAVVFGGYPDVWLTFYNGKLQSWTVIPQS
jgi:hypothetical protein